MDYCPKHPLWQIQPGFQAVIFWSLVWHINQLCHRCPLHLEWDNVNSDVLLKQWYFLCRILIKKQMWESGWYFHKFTSTIPHLLFALLNSFVIRRDDGITNCSIVRLRRRRNCHELFVQTLSPLKFTNQLASNFMWGILGWVSLPTLWKLCWFSHFYLCWITLRFTEIML